MRLVEGLTQLRSCWTEGRTQERMGMLGVKFHRL